MNRAQKFSWVLIGVGFCSYAAAADTLPSSLRACMKETDAARRLACFDRESALLTGEGAPVARQVDPALAQPASPAPARAAPAASAAGSAAVAATTQSADDKFGYRGNMARAELDKKKAEEQQSDQVTAKITELATLPHGQLLLTLDNGQVWQQKTADRALRLEVGDQVTVKRATLGSFLLTAEGNNGAMRVQRVK
jgi:hypothetical protein